jgi:hypothetical protein
VIFELVGIPLPSPGGERHTTAAHRPPEEQVEGGHHVARGRVADHRLGLITGEYDASHLIPKFPGDDPGLLAQPAEPWKHLLPMWDHDDRRRTLPAVVVCRPEFRRTWSRVYVPKRGRLRAHRAAA